MTKEQIIDTQITDRWGVDWSPMEIVRDFLQNFYDDNPLSDINIEIKGNNVTISAPGVFDYQELLYMGSDKGKDKIGQYGEGFKAATLNALRNHNCKIRILVKKNKLEFYLENRHIGKSIKGLMLCKRSEIKPIKGTKLIINNCTPELTDAFKFGLNYFYYEDNPLFGDLLQSTYEKDIFVFKSSNEKGFVFYNKLLRATLDIPIVIVCNRDYKTINQKIKHDRDRKAFNDDVLNKFIKTVCKPLYQIDSIVNYLQPYWEKGHKVLSALADSVSRSYKMEFPENYYAKHSQNSNFTMDMLNKIEIYRKEYEKKRHIQCPGYFNKLGMKTIVSEIDKKERLVKEKHEKLYSRNPTDNEMIAINHLSDYINKIDSSLVDRFKSSTYTIGDSDEIIGELRKKRGWNSNNIFLSNNFFTLSFANSLAILLHEWGHIYGYDGSRNFTDALTEFIAEIIKERTSLNEHEIKWEKIRRTIVSEQKNSSKLSLLDYAIEKLTSNQKTILLKKLPQDELFKLLEEDKFI